jgi:hypothetical protein
MQNAFPIGRKDVNDPKDCAKEGNLPCEYCSVQWYIGASASSGRVCWLMQGRQRPQELREGGESAL